MTTLTTANQTICSGSATQSISLKSSIVGSTFNWTGSSINITGYTKSGNAATIPSQALNDTSTSTGDVVYVITSTAGGCAGLPVSDTIFVNPTPNVNQPQPQTICSGSSTSVVTLTSNTSGTTFNWTASGNASLTGFTKTGAGNIPSQTITNSGTDLDTVIYTITPSANGCQGVPVHFLVMVSPPLQVSLPTAQSVCSGANTSVVTFTSNVPGTTYSWTATSSNGISGYTAGGTGNIPAQKLTNSTGAAGSVIYTISSSGNGCNGSTQNYLITVDPVITANAVPSKDTVCTGVQINISLTANIPGATFSWIVNAPVGVSGASAGSGNSIQQTLTSTSQVPQTVAISVTPSANGCSSQPDTVTVMINPGLTYSFHQRLRPFVRDRQPSRLASAAQPVVLLLHGHRKLMAWLVYRLQVPALYPLKPLPILLFHRIRFYTLWYPTPPVVRGKWLLTGGG